MKRLMLALVIIGIVIYMSAVAEQSAINAQSQGEVNFVTGGVGAEERQELQALRGEYNLQLLFILKDSGSYLSDVKVRIEDAKGVVYLETVADGPLLFAKLKPGNYTVHANQDGYEINKKALIGTEKSTSLIFSWPKQ
ncbi:carboxypeptidase regulatory-like domain-containing protein [Methylomonas sp. AM2-LC]|uniref:carboxypeptidase regulatory-like domain-containing protein n=1 Tax=Methylomonas sp. AM2-LC TaxID=3153301 RepID=UPI003266CEB4